MTNYIWRAQDKSGASVVREVSADTTELAKAILIAEGCTHLELLQDEVMAAAIEGMDKNVSVLGETIAVTAEQRAKLIKNPTTYWRLIGQGIGQSKGLLLIALALGAYLIYGGHWVSALFVATGLIAWLLFVIGVSLPLLYYNRLIKAVDWDRWEEVLDLIAKLEANNKINLIKVPAAELARHRAKVLAGTGRLAEAVAYYQQFENQPGCPSWLYQGLLVGIYNTAQQHDKALECSLKQIELKQTPSGYLDLANQIARYHNDIARARQALVEAEKSTIPETAKPFHHRCRGVVAYLEGDLAQARQELQYAIQLMEATPNQPFRDGNLSIAKAYLACVQAKLGESTEASKLFNQAREYLAATNENDLIAECKQALGRTA